MLKALEPVAYECFEPVEAGVVSVGDYGPDAGATSARGPQGQVEFNRVTGPGFYGRPYCTDTNTSSETYAEWDFATNTAGAKYNCSGGRANSPHEPRSY